MNSKGLIAILFFCITLLGCGRNTCRNIESFDINLAYKDELQYRGKFGVPGNIDNLLFYLDVADSMLYLSGIRYDSLSTTESYLAFKNVTVLQLEGDLYRPLPDYDNHQIESARITRLNQKEVSLDIVFRNDSAIWKAFGYLKSKKIRCRADFPCACDLIMKFRSEGVP